MIKAREAVDLSRLPAGIRSTYERARYLRQVSGRIERALPRGAAIVHRVQTDAFAMATGLLRSLIPSYPRPTLDEYEAFVARAIEQVRSAPGTTAVVQGPGALNLDLASRGLAADAVERYRAVDQMARRVASAHGALYVDRWSTVSAGFFLPGMIRPAPKGHLVWGHLLASEILAAGLV